MKRRIVSVLLILVFVLGTSAVAKTVYETIKAQLRPDFVVAIDGVEREFKNVDGERVYPILYEGTTYLPVRAIGEIMGKKVYWNEEAKKVELKDDDKKASTVTDADVIITDEKAEPVKKDKKAEISEEADFIGKDKAKALALKKAELKEEDVTFVKVELDRERGVYVYEVEFRKGFKEYNAEIKADDGTFVDWEVEFDV